MGNTNESSGHEEVSDLYWACQNGDVQRVATLLSSMTYEQINAIQSNGSTALHAASFHGHAQIVKMLLDHGCNRTIVNRHKLTAYQEAKDDRTREMFRRPDSDEPRFMSTNTRDLFKLKAPKNITDVPDNWLRGYSSVSDTLDAQFVIAVNRSNIFRFLMQNKTEIESNRNLQELVEENIIKKNHDQSSRMAELLKKFLHHRKNRIDHLIQMYTVESPFYRELQNDNSPFTLTLYMHLHEYRDRAYQGISYRGAAMTISDIEAYQWAQQHHSRVLETCTVQSTLMEKEVTEDFARRYQTRNKHTILLIYKFPDKYETALALTKVTDNENLRCLSDFEQEAEVLVLPYTLFQVTKIEFDQKSRWYHICLQNVPVPKKSVLTAWSSVLAPKDS